jgi:membrane protein DedA with SNARE-associated domain
MSGAIHAILTVPGWAVLLVVGLVVFAEDALFVGFVLPGETAAVLGGVAAKLGHAPLWAVLLTVVLAAIIGDSVGYEVGRTLGPRVLAMRILDKRRARLDEARGLLARRGGAAVFLGRWVAFFRAVMPALAGVSRMRYPKFLVFNAAGGLVWGTVVVLVGYAAGASYATVEKTVGRGTALAVLAVALVALLVWRIRRHRDEESGGQRGQAPAPQSDNALSSQDERQAHS